MYAEHKMFGRPESVSRIVGRGGVSRWGITGKHLGNGASDVARCKNFQKNDRNLTGAFTKIFTITVEWPKIPKTFPTSIRGIWKWQIKNGRQLIHLWNQNAPLLPINFGNKISN